MNSTHKAEVVEVNLEKHPDADSLSVVRIGGYTVVVKTSDWKEKYGVYITPESQIDTTRPEFAFLHKGRQFEVIKVRKLRGVYSQGLLVKVPVAEFEVGQDFAEYFGVVHYTPPEYDETNAGEDSKSPIAVGKYDVDSLRKYRYIIADGEPIFVTEKCHGQNIRCIWKDEQLYVGTRNRWVKEGEFAQCWKVIRSQRDNIEALCKAYPGHVLYGEGVGFNPGFEYGYSKANLGFLAFELMKPDLTFINAETARSIIAGFNIKQVPTFGVMPFNYDKLAEMIEKPSPYFPFNKCMEGVVVKPLVERQPNCGRVIFKLVSNVYLEKS